MPRESSQNRPLHSGRPTSLSLWWISSLYLSSCLGRVGGTWVLDWRGERDAHQQAPLIYDVGWCLDDVIARVTTSKLQKLLPWRSLSLFFSPAVKCGQGLKQWNERVNLHKSKERHSGVLECLCLYISVCVLVCLCAEMHVGFWDPSLPCLLVDGSTSSCVMSGLCYAESWPTQSVDWK